MRWMGCGVWAAEGGNVKTVGQEVSVRQLGIVVQGGGGGEGCGLRWLWDWMETGVVAHGA